MNVILTNEAFKDRAREIVDWTVFSLGALSLTFAISATVVNSLGSTSTDTAAAPVVQVERPVQTAI